MSLTRSTWSHHFSSPAAPNDTEWSAGGSTLIFHTVDGTDYRIKVHVTSIAYRSIPLHAHILVMTLTQTLRVLVQNWLVEYKWERTSRDRFERFSCPLFLACLRRASETPLPLLVVKPGLGRLPPRPLDLCIASRKNYSIFQQSSHASSIFYSKHTEAWKCALFGTQ